MPALARSANANNRIKTLSLLDKTFTVIADILLKVLPTTKREKEAFTYYRDGMCAQAEGEYAEALQNYYEAMRLELRRVKHVNW